MKPLVSILIPTYNRVRYFVQALLSAFNQTYENIEIIICDNSEGSETTKIVEGLLPHFAIPVCYHKNTANIGHTKNMHRCFELAKGEFINYLMDDDLFHPQKIEKMMQYFLNWENISFVTSYRLTIDELGCTSRPRRSTKQLFKEDTVLPGKKLAEIMLKNRANYAGEPTTVLFKRDLLQEPYGEYCGRKAHFIFDVASWLHLLEKGNAVYIAEPLSFFRIHETQMQNYPQAKLDSRNDWDEFRRLWREKHGEDLFN